MPEPPKKLPDQVRDSLRMKQCSYRTEQTYVDWIKRYIFFHIKQHPKDMGAPEIQAFLTYLAQDRRVSASTQYQALITLLCLYKNVLRQRIDHLPNLVHAGRLKHISTVLTHEEVTELIDNMVGKPRLMAHLLYGIGLMLTDCLRLRVKDIDFNNHQIIVRDMIFAQYMNCLGTRKWRPP